MACEIVMYSVWTRKNGVRLFPTIRQAVDYRLDVFTNPKMPLENVSKIGKHPIKIEDAVSVTVTREDEKDA